MRARPRLPTPALHTGSPPGQSGTVRPTRRTPCCTATARRANEVSFDDANPAGPSLADRLVYSADILDDHGRRIGSDGADCVVVRIDATSPPSEQQTVECMVSVQLPDGQLTFQGLGRGRDNVFALTGGTGAYRTARGEAVVHDRAPLQVADITVRLVRR
jgi:hypothetical protein